MKCALTLGLSALFAVWVLAEQSTSSQQGTRAGASNQTGSVKASSELVPSQIFVRASPSVVVIVAENKTTQSEALGSGFVVGRDRIATNHHVVEGMKEAFVLFSDGKVKPALNVVADSVQQDLIILTVETDNRPPLSFGDELNLHQGDPVYALGAPKGLQLSFTNGIVSSFRKSNAQFLIQTTAPIAPGSSGGPLLDRAGRVVGVTTSMISDAPGIYFSVGIGDVKRLLKTPQTVALPFSEWAEQQVNRNTSGSPNSVPSTQGTSLEETISWMSTFLEAHGQEWVGGVPLQSNIMGAKNGGPACAVFVTHNYENAMQLHTDMKAPVKTATELMLLSDIDVRSVKVCGGPHVCLETTNNLNKILEVVPIDDKGTKVSEYDLDRSAIILDSLENAERFANALKHAISLCGGSKSLF
jgi:S1-C subfamily serine protease